MWSYSEMSAAFKPREEGALEWNHFAGMLLLDFLASSTVRNKLLFKPASLQYFVMAAWADYQEVIFIKY